MNKLSLTSFVVLYIPTDKKPKFAASKDIEHIQSSDNDTEDEQDNDTEDEHRHIGNLSSYA